MLWHGCRRHPSQQGLQLQLRLVVVLMAIVLFCWHCAILHACLLVALLRRAALQHGIGRLQKHPSQQGCSCSCAWWC